MKRRPGVDHHFPRHQNPGAGIGRQVRLAVQDLCPGQRSCIGHAIAMRGGQNSGQGRLLHFGPGDDHRPGQQHRQVHRAAQVHEFGITRLHAAQFQRPLGRVETGVEQGRIGFAGTGQDVAALFQQQHPLTGQRQPPGRGDPGHPGADHGNVKAFHRSLMPLTKGRIHV